MWHVRAICHSCSEAAVLQSSGSEDRVSAVVLAASNPGKVSKPASSSVLVVQDIRF